MQATRPRPASARLRAMMRTRATSAAGVAPVFLRVAGHTRTEPEPRARREAARLLRTSPLRRIHRLRMLDCERQEGGCGFCTYPAAGCARAVAVRCRGRSGKHAPRSVPSRSSAGSSASASTPKVPRRTIRSIRPRGTDTDSIHTATTRRAFAIPSVAGACVLYDLDRAGEPVFLVPRGAPRHKTRPPLRRTTFTR